ncbi:MAG: fatty acid desaturase family protein [Bacteroidota bacterium]
MLLSFTSKNYSYPRYHRVSEIISVFLFILYSVLLSIELFRVFLTIDTYFLFLAIAMIPAGYIAADFASGLVHFLCDNFGTPETPWFGPSFIKSFRDHHTDPKGITRHDFIEVNGSNCFVSVFVLIPVYYFTPYQYSIAAALFSVFVLSLILFVFLTNQFHKWAHQDSPPAVIKKLQKTGLILGTDHHAVHHTQPYNKYYCITCGWLNPLFTKIKFFEGLEWFITRILRVKKDPGLPE